MSNPGIRKMIRSYTKVAAGLEAVGSRRRRRVSGAGHPGRIAGLDPAENPASGILAFALIYPCGRLSTQRRQDAGVLKTPLSDFRSLASASRFDARFLDFSFCSVLRALRSALNILRFNHEHID